MRAERFIPTPTRRRRPSAGAFTLVEILIVVVILGILAAVVLPQFSSASQQARENTLLDTLRYLRTQVEVYAAQHHDVPPGYPDGDAGAGPTEGAFVDQLVRWTDPEGRVLASVAPGACGPYLNRMPANPVNGRSTVWVMPGDDWTPPDGSTGWAYNPRLRKFSANLNGSDLNGTPYADY